ncbi:hypothetical protein MLD38_005276 [Melastoma candidum]|uniref:Uncharacterized protein n=1 Tax=Melastoma candidum TaxID=119954 RepID=A0ACB9S9X2_9MYRT|nr:hypothetical protein MLD38_005276 [Melastoma candidum]
MYFHGVNHLNIEGNGIVYGRGDKWWKRLAKRGIHARRLQRLSSSTAVMDDLAIQDLGIINGQHTHVTFTHCHRVMAINHKKPHHLQALMLMESTR